MQRKVAQSLLDRLAPAAGDKAREVRKSLVAQTKSSMGTRTNLAHARG